MKVIVNALVALALVACAIARCAGAQVSQEDLNTLNALRGHGNNPAGDVESQGGMLIQKHNDAESQGKIYFQMTETYGQSNWAADPVAVQKTIEYAQKALGFPLDPQKRLRLYCYWGDAIQVAHRGAMGNDLAAARPESVTPYLQGLRAALQYNLPDDPPEIPRGGINLIDRSPGGAENMRRAQLLQEARAKAAETAIRQGELIQMREILIGQVVFLYSRKPFATDEIRALATQVIADDHLVGRLMGAVEDAVNERTTTGGPGTPYMVKVIPKFLEPSQPADAQQPATAVTAKP